MDVQNLVRYSIREGTDSIHLDDLKVFMGGDPKARSKSG